MKKDYIQTKDTLKTEIISMDKKKDVEDKKENKSKNYLHGITIYKINDEKIKSDAAKKPLSNTKKNNIIKNLRKDTINKFEVIDDLSEVYVVQYEISTNENLSVDVISPEEINPMDSYELNESISKYLKENYDIKLSRQQDISTDAQITNEAKEKFKEIALKFLKKKKENDSSERTDGDSNG